MIEIVQAVEEADVPNDLRASAFEKAFDAVLGTQAPASEGAGPPIPPAGHDLPPKSNGEPPANGPSLETMAARLKLPEALVSEIFYVDNDDLGLALAHSKLARTRAAATQQIALLIAAGRQAGGWDEWTAVGRIRDVCREYGCLDPANFATTVRRMGGAFSYRGRARNLEVRLTRPGYEQAASLARELGEA